MKRFAIFLALIAGPADAQDTASNDDVLGCIQTIDSGTTWNQCLELMFSACDPAAVGTRDHAACLFDLRERWRIDMVTRQTEVLKMITPKAGGELVDFLSAWPTYVDRKCVALSLEKPETDALAARFGCEVSESVLISSEFQACLDGRSTESYCVPSN